MTIRIGVIGAGRIGRLRAATVHTHPQTTLAAVCDVNRGAAQAAAQGSTAVVCSTLDEFFAVPMDAVIISSPVQMHEEQCLRAFALGQHVLCEKPLSNSTASAERILAASRAAGKVLGVGFNLRFYPAMQYVREVVDAGTIGPIDHIRVFGGHDGLNNFTADWQYKAPVSGGGAMMDVGIHITDIARWFLGDVTDVYGVVSEAVWKVPGSEDNAMAIFRNAAGITATYHATWDEWQGYEVAIEVYGPKGMVRGAYAPMQALLITHEKPGGPRTVVKKRYLDIAIREKLRSWTTTTQATFDGELADWLRRMQGGTGGALATGVDGVRSLQVRDAVVQSSATRQAVALPPLPVG